jgi:hypothetical protein
MDWILRIIVSAFAMLAYLTMLAAFLAYPVKWLVNYVFAPGVLVSLFGTPQIGFWQALALTFLCGILFKSSSSSSSKRKE